MNLGKPTYIDLAKPKSGAHDFIIIILLIIIMMMIMVMMMKIVLFTLALSNQFNTELT